jgi:UDP-N-acetylglucosamine 3-dehydrogenase
VSDVAAALPHVDAVDVVTPADSHLALARAALAAGRHCFVEKPLTRHLAEAVALCDLARAAGRVVQVGHVFRFHPVTEVLREHLARGTIGAVRYATGRFAGFKRPRADVGAMQTDALHYFDLFAHLLGRPPTAVTALLRDFLGRGLDDLAFTTVEYGDVPVMIEAGYFAPGTHRDCLIVGTEGALAADFGTAQVRIHAGRHVPAGPGAWQAVQGRVETVTASGPEPLGRELAAFIAAIATGGPSPVGPEAGLRALQVGAAAEESARLGRRVDIHASAIGTAVPARLG